MADRYAERLAEAARKWREADKTAKQFRTAEQIAEQDRKTAEKESNRAYQELYDLLADVAGEAGADAVHFYGNTLKKLGDA